MSKFSLITVNLELVTRVLRRCLLGWLLFLVVGIWIAKDSHGHIFEHGDTSLLAHRPCEQSNFVLEFWIGHRVTIDGHNCDCQENSDGE